MARRRRGRTQTRKARPTLTGTLRVVRPGTATVETAEGTFVVARGGIREGMNGDEVSVTLVHRGRGGEPSAVVQGVITRATSSLLGTYATAEPLGVVTPLDARIAHDFFVLPGDDSAARAGVTAGDVVVARILAYPTRHESGVATIERRVGATSELDLAIEAVIASFGLATEFGAAALAEAAGMTADASAALGNAAGNEAGSVTAIAEVGTTPHADHAAADAGSASDVRESGGTVARGAGTARAPRARRRDLRGACVVTVDPADARDFDDAVSAARRADGGYDVGVHIADVTHYLRWDTSLDVEARARTCSTYLVDRVLPMLPERLSNDVCSLRPGVDRLTMSVFLRLDAAGEVVDAHAERTVIRSRARLSYDEVDALLAGTATAADLPVAGCVGTSGSGGLGIAPDAVVAAGAKATPNVAAGTLAAPGVADASVTDAAPIANAVANTLFTLAEVARLREGVRAARGAVDFATREAKVVLDERGTPTGVRVRAKTAATSLVEEAMLMANEAVASMLADAGARAAYRVHDRPAPDDVASAVPALRELGVLRAGEVDALLAGIPAVTRAVLARAASTPAEYVTGALLLRAQRRAVYKPTNEGHYALGASAYCHFTSPIRRYPDVIVHRALKALIDGGAPPAGMVNALPQLCRSCSDQERVADAAARESQRVKMAELYATRIGERVAGIVVGVERFGLFVMDDDTCAEGLLPVRALGDEWFSYDESRMMLSGDSTGRTWRLGQRVAVVVAGTKPERGQIDFRLVS